MALDDRDKRFEKALAHHLGYCASTSAEPGSLSASSLPCPDAEILAAYHDESLTPDERALWKQHVLKCERCQFVLEHLATPLTVEAQSNQAQLTEKLAGVEAMPAAAPSSTSAAQAPVSIARPARKTYLRWLAPAGAVAAGILAYVVLHPAKPIQAPQAHPTLEIAKNEAPPAAPIPTSPAANATAAVDSLTSQKNKDQSALVRRDAGAASQASNEKELTDEIAKLEKAPPPSKTAPAPPQASRYAGGQRELDMNQAARGSGASAAAAERQSELKAKVDALQAEMRKQGLAQHSPQPASAVAAEAGYLADKSVAPPPPAAPTPPAPVVGGNAPASSPKPTDAKEAPAITLDSATASSTESVEVSSQLPLNGRMRSALLKNPHIFGAPSGKILWRVGPAGSIERSTNKGKDWTPQVSGVLTDLLTGSAPSAKVSWIVGSAGTILRTTDGGEHWTKINSPAPGELAGIRATDALHAYIWFAPDPRTGLVPSFQTVDGGSTWIVVPAS